MKLDAWVEVKVTRPDGKLRGRVKKKSDSPLQNFAVLTLFSAFPKGDVAQSFSLIAEDGLTYTFKIPDATLSPTSYATSTSYPLYLEVGNSDTPVSRTDYKLGYGLLSIPASSYTVSDTGTSIQLTVSGSRTIFLETTSDYIREAGLSVYLKDSGGTMRRVLLIRDVVSDLLVYNGDSVTASYTITRSV